MLTSKAHMISQLQKEILLLQGFKPSTNSGNDGGLALIRHHFPNSNFPTGALHEFLYNSVEDVSATSGFVSGIVSSIMKQGGAGIWITSSHTIFPPALKAFGIEPDKMIFLVLRKEKEKLWVMEEAFKCEGVTCVVAEIDEINFTESRRFQLAVEQTRVTGFVLRCNPKNLSTSCVTRWRIKPLASEETGFPGVGFPRWNADLLKVRNGKPGQWQMQWKSGKFGLVNNDDFIAQEQRKIV